ncbi:MAG: MinD/ParA family protein [Chloroflexota bacterium]
MGDIDRITSRESSLVQSMNNIKPILDRLTLMFGKEKTVLVNELLKHQARLGILRHNYNKLVDENTKKTTYEEITLVRDKMERVRKKLGPWVMLYIRDVFAEESIQLWNNFTIAIEEKASSNSSNNVPNLWYTLNNKMTPHSKINTGELSNQQWRSKMSKIVAIHSFRGGTGKTNITANIAAQTALRGKRVAIIDTDIQSPGIHVLFGLDDQKMKRTLNEFLHGDCAITDVALNIGENVPDLPGLVKLKNKDIWLIPSSINCAEISRILRDGFDVNLLNQGLHNIRETLELDYLFIDTHPGLQETTLLSIAISDILIILLRPDQQDFQGTAVTVTIARSLDIPEIWLLVNKVLNKYDFNQIKTSVESIYNTEVAGVMPLSEELVELGSSDIFSLCYPDHPWSKTLISVVDKLAL